MLGQCFKPKASGAKQIKHNKVKNPICQDANSWLINETVELNLGLLWKNSS